MLHQSQSHVHQASAPTSPSFANVIHYIQEERHALLERVRNLETQSKSAVVVDAPARKSLFGDDDDVVGVPMLGRSGERASLFEHAAVFFADDVAHLPSSDVSTMITKDFKLFNVFDLPPRTDVVRAHAHDLPESDEDDEDDVAPPSMDPSHLHQHVPRALSPPPFELPVIEDAKASLANELAVVKKRADRRHRAPPPPPPPVQPHRRALTVPRRRTRAAAAHNSTSSELTAVESLLNARLRDAIAAAFRRPHHERVGVDVRFSIVVGGRTFIESFDVVLVSADKDLLMTARHAGADTLPVRNALEQMACRRHGGIPFDNADALPLVLLPVVRSGTVELTLDDDDTVLLQLSVDPSSAAAAADSDSDDVEIISSSSMCKRPRLADDRREDDLLTHMAVAAIQEVDAPQPVHAQHPYIGHKRPRPIVQDAAAAAADEALANADHAHPHLGHKRPRPIVQDAAANEASVGTSTDRVKIGHKRPRAIVQDADPAAPVHADIGHKRPRTIIHHIDPMLASRDFRHPGTPHVVAASRSIASIDASIGAAERSLDDLNTRAAAVLASVEARIYHCVPQ